MDIPSYLQESNLLYHYTTAKTAIKYILRNHSIKFNLLVNTQDPRENKYWTFSWNAKNKENINKIPNMYVNDKKKMIDKLKYGCKVICFTIDNEDYFRRYPIDRYPFDKNPEAIFAKGFARSRMWTQYAEGQTGLCLIFKKNVFEERIISVFGEENMYKGPVEYTIELSII